MGVIAITEIINNSDCGWGMWVEDGNNNGSFTAKSGDFAGNKGDNDWNHIMVFQPNTHYTGDYVFIPWYSDGGGGDRIRVIGKAKRAIPVPDAFNTLQVDENMKNALLKPFNSVWDIWGVRWSAGCDGDCKMVTRPSSGIGFVAMNDGSLEIRDMRTAQIFAPHLKAALQKDFNYDLRLIFEGNGDDSSWRLEPLQGAADGTAVIFTVLEELWDYSKDLGKMAMEALVSAATKA